MTKAKDMAVEHRIECMNTQRNKPIKPSHLFWRNRVEGQIRHTINEHPEWFNLEDEETKNRCVSSMAKRIIGEIVAGTYTGNNVGKNVHLVVHSSAAEKDASMSVLSTEGSGSLTAILRVAEPAMSEDEAVEIMHTSISNHPANIYDITRMRIAYRALMKARGE